MVRNGKECKNPRFSSVAATLEKASTYVFAGCLIRTAEARGSIPSAPPLVFNGLQPPALAAFCLAYLDIFVGAELDRLNRHPLGILNGSHITHRHAARSPASPGCHRPPWSNAFEVGSPRYLQLVHGTFVSTSGLLRDGSAKTVLRLLLLSRSGDRVQGNGSTLGPAAHSARL